MEKSETLPRPSFRYELIKKATTSHTKWWDDCDDSRSRYEFMADFCMEQRREILIEFLTWFRENEPLDSPEITDTVDEFLNQPKGE